MKDADFFRCPVTFGADASVILFARSDLDHPLPAANRELGEQYLLDSRRSMKEITYLTGIPACILVIDKEDARSRKGIFMIDASGGFIKDGPKNRLRDMDIHKIVDVFRKRRDVPKYARMVPFSEIEQNEYNLNLPRYIDSQMDYWAETMQDDC